MLKAGQRVERKLTEQQRAAIRSAYTQPNKDVAAKYNVTPGYVSVLQQQGRAAAAERRAARSKAPTGIRPETEAEENINGQMERVVDLRLKHLGIAPKPAKASPNGTVLLECSPTILQLLLEHLKTKGWSGHIILK